MSEDETFWQRDIKVWELYYYYGNIKILTMFFRFVVYIAHAKFQVISFNNLKDIQWFSNMLKFV